MQSGSRQFPTFEGTWEEVLQRAKALSGRRVRVIVLSDEPTAPLPLEERWRRFFAAIDASSPPRPSSVVAKSDPFTEGLVEKFRKQGLRL